MREIKIIGMDELEIIEVYGKWRLEHLRETKIYFVCYNGKVEVEGTYKECKKFFNKYAGLTIIGEAASFAGTIAGTIAGCVIATKIIDILTDR